jgi:amino acid transporter
MTTKNSQTIGLTTAIVVGMNAMIGAGIFSAPPKLMSYVGPAGIFTFLFVVIAVWAMASSFARLGQLFPTEGSFYTYAHQWGGHAMGLVSSGSYILGVIIGMGLLLQLAGIYLHDYLPFLSSYTIGLVALTFLVLVTMIGGRATGALQIISLCCTTIPILIITLMCLSKASLSNLQPFAPHGFGNILRATQAVIFGFFGFESVASLFAIVKNPKENVPKALGYSLLAVSILYFLFIFSIMLATPIQAVTHADTPLSHILLQIFPNRSWLITIIHFSITASFLSVLNAMLFATANLFLSLIHRMKFFKQASFFNKQNATLLIGFCIAVSYRLLQNIDLFFNFTALFVIVAFITALIALFTVKQSSWQFVQTITGLGTAGIILFFAIEGIVSYFTGH